MNESEWVAFGNGLRRRTMVDGDKMTVLEIHYTGPGTGAPTHNHPHEQISYVLKGRVEFTVADKMTVLTPGSIIHVPGNVMHSATASEESTMIEMFSPPREEFRAK